MTTQRKAQPTARPWSLRPVARWAVALSLVGAMGGALGQGAAFEPSPEFEAWIAEAEKVKKDPVDFVQEMRQAGKVTFAQSRAFNRYVLARIEARIAKLDAEAKEGEARIAKKEAELMEKTKIILTAMKSLEAQGRFGPKAVADLNNMYNGGTEEVRALIRSELGKYLKP